MSGIRVTSLLWVWKGAEAGRWYFITIPEDQSAEFRAEAFGNRRGFGSVKVEAAIDDIRWRTSVFPLKGGGYLLPVKAEVRRRAGIGAGDQVTIDVSVL